MRKVRKDDLLVLDDRDIRSPPAEPRHDALEVVDTRLARRSTVIASPCPLSLPTVRWIVERLMPNASSRSLCGTPRFANLAVLRCLADLSPVP